VERVDKEGVDTNFFIGKKVSEINFIMDNCAGQNKNRMVIRLLFVLVKLKLCFKATMVFLVKGHTKNDCDRMFNLMKQAYRKTNCYTPKQLMEFVAQSNEDVELVDVMQSGGFKDWDKYQNKYMKAPDSIQNYHVFQVNARNSNRLMCQEAYGYPIINDDTVVRKQFRDQDWGSLQDELEEIPPLGLKDIKWITLYDEWRPLIPLDFRKDYQYFHNDPGPERRQKNKLNRGEAAAARMQRATTIDEPKKRKRSPGKKVAAAVAKKKKSPTMKKPAPKKVDHDKKPAARKRGPFSNIQFGKL
jgi:hypothetical protein